MKKETKEVKATKSTNEFKYDINQLLDNCEDITGKKREVGEGALHDIKVDKMTKAEFKAKVESFLNKKIKATKEKEVK